MFDQLFGSSSELFRECRKGIFLSRSKDLGVDQLPAVSMQVRSSVRKSALTRPSPVSLWKDHRHLSDRPIEPKKAYSTIFPLLLVLKRTCKTKCCGYKCLQLLLRESEILRSMPFFSSFSHFIPHGHSTTQLC